MARTRLIFGCGYLGRRVAARWRDAGDRVIAATRSSETAERFAAEGLEPLVADVTRPETLVGLPAADTVLFAVGYDRSAVASIHEAYAGGVRNVLAALPRDAGRFLYVSTTGVYGDAGGAWVDESTPIAPSRDGGKASLAAEEALAQQPMGRPLGVAAAGGHLRDRSTALLGEAASGRADRGAADGLAEPHPRR